uniref:Uncharacterized protein n=1 Tax=Oryza punctata TaxID=4537 RepID=A0A0E0MHF6_ORYPU
MDLKTIKILLRYPRGSVEYLAGVDGFLQFAYKDKVMTNGIFMVSLQRSKLGISNHSLTMKTCVPTCMN